MKKLHLLIICFLLICIEMFSQSESKEYKLTVILHSNQNPNSIWTKETLLKDSIINTKETNIDIYFCNYIAHIPYYLPTNGIYKDSIKEKECNRDEYPKDVKCYSYDDKNRVSTMSVEGSGTMGTWTYKYDDLNRIMEINWLSDTYKMYYDSNNGFVNSITVDSGLIKEKLELIYK